MKTIRIGAGAGYSGDRIAPAIDLVRRGRLNYIVFECLAERTIALAQQRKSRNPLEGFDPKLEERMRAILPLLKPNGTRLISNMGAANPIAAAQTIHALASELHIAPLKIAAVIGDDVLELFRGELRDTPILETGMPVSTLAGNLVSANAYLGADAIVEALRNGADIVIGGRIADPSLFLAPLIHEFNWPSDAYGLLGQGILTGHLLECAGQLTGGYFADPPFKQVPDIVNLGFPFADISEDGAAEFSKLPGSGGEINLMTAKEQLLYEIHDPARYITPDVIADFSQVELIQIAPDRVAARGATGHPRPVTLKVSLGSLDGFLADGQISYAGPGARERASLAIEIVRAQLASQNCRLDELRCDLIGLDAIDPRPHTAPISVPEVRVRVAGRARNMHDAELLVDTVEALYTNGPAAGGGAFKSIRPVMSILSALIPRQQIAPRIHYFETA